MEGQARGRGQSCTPVKQPHKGVSSLSLEVCELYVHNGQIMTRTIQPCSLYSAFTNTPPLIFTATSEGQVPSVYLFPQAKLKEVGALKKLFRALRIK